MRRCQSPNLTRSKHRAKSASILSTRPTNIDVCYASVRERVELEVIDTSMSPSFLPAEPQHVVLRTPAEPEHVVLGAPTETEHVVLRVSAEPQHVIRRRRRTSLAEPQHVI